MESRITQLENQISLLLGKTTIEPISVIEQTLEDEPVITKSQTLLQIQNMFKTSSSEIGLDLSCFTKVCKFVVTFIDNKISDIINIMNKDVSSEQKLKIAVGLVQTIFEVDPELIRQTIQAQFDILKQSDTVLTLRRQSTIEFPIHQPPTRAKRRFSITRRRKPNC